MKNKITSSWRVPRNLDGQAAVPYLDTKWGLVDGGGWEGANCSRAVAKVSLRPRQDFKGLSPKNGKKNKAFSIEGRGSCLPISFY